MHCSWGDRISDRLVFKKISWLLNAGVWSKSNSSRFPVLLIKEYKKNLVCVILNAVINLHTYKIFIRFHVLFFWWGSRRQQPYENLKNLTVIGKLWQSCWLHTKTGPNNTHQDGTKQHTPRRDQTTHTKTGPNKVGDVVTPRTYERGVQQIRCSGARQLRRGPRLKEHWSVCYQQTRNNVTKSITVIELVWTKAFGKSVCCF